MAHLTLHTIDFSSDTKLPLAEGNLQAGFPSPVASQYEEKIDLNHELVAHPESTFYARVSGDSMIEANIFEGDILVVDRSLEVRNGDIAVCVVDGEFTVKYVFLEKDGARLVPANPLYPELRIDQGNTFDVWGIVTHVIHHVPRSRGTK